VGGNNKLHPKDVMHPEFENKNGPKLGHFYLRFFFQSLVKVAVLPVLLFAAEEEWVLFGTFWGEEFG
jgi:hypothetical protein